MLLHVDVLDEHLDNVTNGEQVGGMLYESVGHLGNVEESVVVNSDINKASEINNVTDGALKLHTGLKIGDLENVGGEDGSGSVVSDIPAGLLQLVDDILKGGLSAAKLLGKLGDAVLLALEAEQSEATRPYVLGGEAEALEKILRYRVGLGVYAGIVKDLGAAGNAKEARALGERLVTDLGHLEQLTSGLEFAVLLSVLDYILCGGGVDARNIGQERVGGGIDVNADTVYAILDYAAESLGKARLLHIVLILTYSDSLGLDLYKLGKGILQTAGNGYRATLHYVKLGELLCGEL